MLVLGGGRTIWRYSVFANFLGGDTVIWIKNGRYSVFQSPNGDGKIQFLIENTTVTVFIQKFDYGITVIFEKINGNTVIQSLVRPPLIQRNLWINHEILWQWNLWIITNQIHNCLILSSRGRYNPWQELSILQKLPYEMPYAIWNVEKQQKEFGVIVF